MKKNYILFLVANFYLCFPFFSFSQNKEWTITGNVVDGTTKELLPFVNVVLYSLPDTVFVTGTATDEKGSFSLNAANKACVLKISMLGYQTATLKVTSEQAGTVSLSPREEMLKEVVIKGSAPLIKMVSNGISADIQNTPLKNMGNLSEVLGQMPFVLKEDNNFTVLGKGTPIFYINNRLVRDNNELQQINSKDIKKVTVITNPGAEYDASVKAVIKIETLRPKGDGLGGTVWTYSRAWLDAPGSSKWYTMDGVSLNYRTGGLDVFANFNYGNMNFPKDRNKTSTIENDNSSITVLSKSKEDDKLKFSQPEIGFNYMINENQSFGARYQYNNSQSLYNYPINTDVFLNNALNEILTTDFNGVASGRSHYVNAYYYGKLSPLFTVRLDMDYKKSNGEMTNDIINSYEQAGDSLARTDNPSNSTLYAGRFTVETPVWGGTFSYGLEGSRTLDNQSLMVIENTGIPGINASTNQVAQNLAAGFVSYSKTFGLFSANAGLRYENVLSRFFQDDVLVAEQSKRYERLFPNFNVSYGGKKLQMSLGYKNSVNRPVYGDLRSSVFYMAPYTYGAGNPLLLPTYTNTLTYMLKYKVLTLMTSYDWNRDYIAEMIPQLYMDNSMMIKPMNIPHTKHLNLSLNFSSTYGVWRPNWDLSVDKDYITFGNPGITFNKPVLVLNFRNNFNVKGWQLGLNPWLRSRGYQNASHYDKIMWKTDVYVNKSFFHNKLQVNIAANDIFDTVSDYPMTFINNGLRSSWDDYMYRRCVILDIHYNFNIEQNNRYKGQRSTDELNRL